MRSKYIDFEHRNIQARLASLQKRKQYLEVALPEVHKHIQLGQTQYEEQFKHLYREHKQVAHQINSLRSHLFNIDIKKRDQTHYEGSRRARMIGITLSVMLLFFGAFATQPSFLGITGFATSAQVSAISNVSITQNVAIQANNLSMIQFGDLLPNTDDNNATTNYNGTNEATAFIYMAPNNSVDVDFCINATLLTSGANTIARANYTFTNGTSTDINTPPAGSLSTAIPDTYAKHINDISSDQRVYYRFWLDIPPQQAAGVYTNAVTFKALAATGNSACA